MSEPLFKLQLYQKRDSATGVFLWILKQFKNTLFTEHLWISASILQQLLALYFAIIYSWQLSSGEKSLVEKKFIHIFQGFYRFRFLSHRYICFFFFHFSLTNRCLPYRLPKRMLYSEQPTVLLAQRHLNTILLTNFENLNSISNIFQENDGPTNYLYLFKNHRQTFSWPGERQSSHLKVTKMWFVPKIKYLSEPFFAVFAAGKASLVLLGI